MKQLLLLFLIFITANIVFSQDVIVIDGTQKTLNRSIANRFTIYSTPKPINLESFDSGNLLRDLEKIELTQSVVNLDFTTQQYFIWFRLDNATKVPQIIYLETARPITNEVTLRPIQNGVLVNDNTQLSGDGIPFSKKSVASNRSILRLKVDAGARQEYLLTVGSDGEIISLPMVFWSASAFEKVEQQRQFTSGLFYGIFLFVILIYFSFYTLLRDRLYLLYTLYVFFSGLLQFSLDGYAHEFLFTSGGYLTQHLVLFVAGFTVFFAYVYAAKYLELAGKLLKASQFLAYLVLATTFVSLIPGAAYELCYPLINGFSLLSLLFILYAALRSRSQAKDVGFLFLFGLISLIIGAVIFILGNLSVIDIPILTQNSLKVGTLVEIICLSILMAGKYKKLQVEKEESQRLLLIELEAKNKITEEANLRLEEEVRARTREIESQKTLLADQNKDLLSSIKYAERIQKALLPSEKEIKNWLPESFVFFKPKDIVSGDFYWMETVKTSTDNPQELLLFATADCTGHGVPGAIVSVVCNNLLKLSKIQRDINTTGEALDFVDKEINELLNSSFKDVQIRDGMDISFCALHKSSRTLWYSGAKIPLYLIRNGELTIYKGDRKSIGFKDDGIESQFHTEQIQLQEGDLLYTFSDGVPDQFGGAEGKKFLTKRLQTLLLEISTLPMEEQHLRIENTMNQWMKTHEQIDDMLLLGIKCVFEDK